jgi:hypothetical protein
MHSSNKREREEKRDIPVEVVPVALLDEILALEEAATKKQASSMSIMSGCNSRVAQSLPFVLRKVISGGQTGADLAGLRAARHLGYETGGTAAPNFSTSAGSQRDLLQTFGLTAIPLGSSHWAAAYSKRTMKNVDDSDATVAFRVKSSAGTEKTIGYCVTHKWTAVPIPGKKTATELDGYRPVIVIHDLSSPDAPLLLRSFLRRHAVKVLNVAGHRASDDLPRWQQQVEAFLINALARDE